MRKFYKITSLLFFSISLLFASCTTSGAWDYSHLLDPKDYAKYYENLDFLRKDLTQKDYLHEPYGNMHGNPHEMWEQTFVEYNYSSTVIVRYDNLDSKNMVGYETWITTDGNEQNTDRFKKFIDAYVDRIKKYFPKRGTQKQKNGTDYELTLSNEVDDLHVTIQNDLEMGSQFIVVIKKKL